MCTWHADKSAIGNTSSLSHLFSELILQGEGGAQNQDRQALQCHTPRQEQDAMHTAAGRKHWNRNGRCEFNKVAHARHSQSTFHCSNMPAYMVKELAQCLQTLLHT